MQEASSKLHLKAICNSFANRFCICMLVYMMFSQSSMDRAFLLSVEIFYLMFSFKPAYLELQNQVRPCLPALTEGGDTLGTTTLWKQPVRHFLSYLVLPAIKHFCPRIRSPLLESDLHSKPRTNSKPVNYMEPTWAGVNLWCCCMHCSSMVNRVGSLCWSKIQQRQALTKENAGFLEEEDASTISIH